MTALSSVTHTLRRSCTPALLILLGGTGLARSAPLGHWAVFQADCQVRTIQAERVERAIPQRQSRASAADHFRLRVGSGSQLEFIAAVPPTPAIEELTIDVSLCCGRPGVQLMARVVLPRSRDAATGQLTSVLLPGPRYSAADRWETLHMANLSGQLDDQVRLLRAQSAVPIDDREAYIDAVLVQCAGGAGDVDLWLGDPGLGGFLPRRSPQALLAAPPQIDGPLAEPLSVQTRGGVLEVDGTPFFARVVEAQGEDWSYLSDLGFNTVRLKRPVTVRDLAAAQRHGLWLMACPPTDEEWPLISQHCGRVLIWDLSPESAALDEHRLRQRAESLQVAARQAARPFACELTPDRQAPPRIGVVVRPAIADVLPDSQTSSALARPGPSVTWGTVSTSLPEPLARQLSWFGIDPMELAPDEIVIQQQAMAALHGGARGLIFQSRQRLDVPTSCARQRSLILRQLNALLDAVSPWLASGIPEVGVREPAIPRPMASGDTRSLRGTLFLKPAGSLVLLTRYGDGDCYVPAPDGDGPCTVALHSAQWGDVVQLAEDVVRRISSRSVPGGIAIPLEHAETVEVLVLTRDAAAIEELARRWAPGHSHRLDQALELTRLRMDDTAEVLRDIDESTVQRHSAWLAVEQARAALTRAKHERDRKNWPVAREQLRQARQGVARARRDTWERVLNGHSPTRCPLAMHYGALGAYVRLEQGPPLGSASWTVLPAGDCDHLTEMQQAGWTLAADNPPGEDARMASVARESFQERECLQLTSNWRSPSPGSNPIARRSPTAVLACATGTGNGGTIEANAAYRYPLAPAVHRSSGSVRLMTPPLAVLPGQVVRIQGWVNLPPSNPDNAFAVYDTHAGEELADRRRVTQGWEPFVIYHVATSERPLQVTFELSGTGPVYLDELKVAMGPQPIRR